MDRRSILVAIGALSSGCLTRVPGGPDLPYISEGTTPSQPSGETPNDTPTGTPTEAPDETSGEQSAETTTEATTEQPAPVDRAIRRSREALDAAVAAYEGDGDSWTGVNAGTWAFSDRSTTVIEHLIDARQAAERARELESTDEEHATIDRLFAVYRILRRAVDTDLALVRGYAAIGNGRDALARGEAPAARASISQVQVRHEIAMEAFGDMSQPSNRGSLDATTALSVERYDTKRSQFRAEIDALGGVVPTLRHLVDAVQRLTEAHNHQEDGNPQSAEDAAKLAVDALEEAQSELETYRNDLGNWTSPFRDAGASLAALIDAKRNEADRILA